jgi:toxin ParE1/3/4
MVRWLLRSVIDLENVFEYISTNNPEAARSEINQILDTVGLLDSNPSMGRPGRVPGTRELVVAGTPYIVAYRAKRRSIEILRVLHGAQKWTDS